MPSPFFTIGHSTRPTEEFVALLKAAEARVVVDVRTVPRSRTNPQFNRDVLPLSLAPHGIAYEHLVSLADCGACSATSHPRQTGSGRTRASQFRRLRDWPGVSRRSYETTRIWACGAPGRHVRRGGLVALSSPHHFRLPDRRGRGGLPHSRPGPHRAPHLTPAARIEPNGTLIYPKESLFSPGVLR